MKTPTVKVPCPDCGHELRPLVNQAVNGKEIWFCDHCDKPFIEDALNTDIDLTFLNTQMP